MTREVRESVKGLIVCNIAEYLMNRRGCDARERLKLCFRITGLWSSTLASLRRGSFFSSKCVVLRQELALTSLSCEVVFLSCYNYTRLQTCGCLHFLDTGKCSLIRASSFSSNSNELED